jgi:hypothetical protein
LKSLVIYSITYKKAKAVAKPINIATKVSLKVAEAAGRGGLIVTPSSFLATPKVHGQVPFTPSPQLLADLVFNVAVKAKKGTNPWGRLIVK